MARREVIEITCDRCERTETQAPGMIAARDKMSHEFSITLHGKSIQYEDLCRSCRKTLANYYDKVIKAKVEQDAPPKKPPTPAPAPPKTGLFNRSKAAG